MRLFNGVRLLDYPSPANVRRLDLGCLPLIAQMQRNGIKVDIPHFQAVDAKLAEVEAGILHDVDYLVQDDYPGFQPGSADQVADLLFNRLKLQVPGGKPRMTKSKSRITTDDEMLSSVHNQHPVVPLIQSYREITKLRTTYAIPIPGMVQADGRLRTAFKVTKARTGRLATGDRDEGLPNLQNIPVRGDWGKDIRNGFVADTGLLIVSTDLSQIEMRWAAHLSKDAAMSRIFIEDLDIHTQTAISMFRLPASEILGLIAADAAGTLTDEQKKALKEFKHRYRLPAKNLGFGVLYGVTGKGLQNQILAAGGPFWTEDECQKFIDRWFDAYPQIRAWMELQYSRMRRYGCVWDGFGRMRLIPEARSTLKDIRGNGERQAGNTPIQASAQGHIKLAMAEIAQVVDYYQSIPGVVCRPLLQVHDELLTECSREIAQEYMEWTREIMRNAVPLSVPVDASGDIAERWGDLK